jgi:hypothetical protein
MVNPDASSILSFRRSEIRFKEKASAETTIRLLSICLTLVGAVAM